MAEKIEFSFAHRFSETIWKTVADAGHLRVFLELRDTAAKQVSFTGFDLRDKNFRWEPFKLDEPWWTTLAGASGNKLFFIVYNDINNPDKKSLIAVDVQSRSVTWWRNDFAISTIAGNIVTGIDTKFGGREIGLNAEDGTPLSKDEVVSPPEQNFDLIRPFQYREGTDHHQTVRLFLEKHARISPHATVEYAEYGSLIVISAFTGPQDLANYLIVANSRGEILLKETLGEHLKGIAFDTFFILHGFLIFAKNKNELVCYKLS